MWSNQLRWATSLKCSIDIFTVSEKHSLTVLNKQQVEKNWWTFLVICLMYYMSEIIYSFFQIKMKVGNELIYQLFSHNFKNSIILIDIIGHICRTDCEIRDVYIVCTDKIMLISISEALNIYHFFLWENVKLHFSISLQN